MKAQEDCFVYQVVLSKVLKLPIIIHERQAFARVMEVLTKYGERSMPIHWHCYTGPIEKASSISNQFPNVKFGATLKLLNDPELQETFRQLPRTSILIESDYPYLGKEPRSDLIRIAACLAKIRDSPVLSIIKACNGNFLKMYSQRCSDNVPMIKRMLDRHQEIMIRERIMKRMFGGAKSEHSLTGLRKVNQHPLSGEKSQEQSQQINFKSQLKKTNTSLYAQPQQEDSGQEPGKVDFKAQLKKVKAAKPSTSDSVSDSQDLSNVKAGLRSVSKQSIEQEAAAGEQTMYGNMYGEDVTVMLHRMLYKRI